MMAGNAFLARSVFGSIHTAALAVWFSAKDVEDTLAIKKTVMAIIAKISFMYVARVLFS
jgi:hypothetical protein